MPSGDVKSHPPETETRLAVGWQKLTKQEFVEALTVALLDKVRGHLHLSEQVDESDFPGSTDVDFVG